MPLLDADALAETAYAKVNLALHVRERRTDGYHELESLFVFARDGDLLTGEATEDGSISLMLDGPFADALEAGEGNLVMKAARLMQERLGEKRGAAIRLTKTLPVASGIGGGSADAAAALRLLNRLWGAQLPSAELERIGLLLGSDVPACISSVTQMVRGRGEVLEQREVQGLTGMPMLLVNPGVALSTAQVFKGWLDSGVEILDFVWRNRSLIVEVDGYDYHRSPKKFESDREQDVTLGMKGWTTRRFTWRQVTTRAKWVAAAIG